MRLLSLPMRRIRRQDRNTIWRWRNECANNKLQRNYAMDKIGQIGHCTALLRSSENNYGSPQSFWREKEIKRIKSKAMWWQITWDEKETRVEDRGTFVLKELRNQYLVKQKLKWLNSVWLEKGWEMKHTVRYNGRHCSPSTNPSDKQNKQAFIA